MIREDKNLFAFTNEANLGLTQRECESVLRSKHFREILRQRRNLYYKELANDPSLSKAAMKGQLVYAITRLIEKGQEDKAVTAIMSLAKFEGWTSDAANVNVFQDLSQKDLNEIRKKFTPIVAKEAN